MADLPEVPPGANMENCPRCTDPNPDYPWICPGHPAESKPTCASDPATDRDETGPTRPVDMAPRCTCGHTRRDHSDRRDHKPSRIVPRRPWCHACSATCDYAPAPAADRRTASSIARLVGRFAVALIRLAHFLGTHVYLSTGCLHGDHDYCQRLTGRMGAKKPRECKHCESRCICPCHDATGKERSA